MLINALETVTNEYRSSCEQLAPNIRDAMMCELRNLQEGAVRLSEELALFSSGCVGGKSKKLWHEQLMNGRKMSARQIQQTYATLRAVTQDGELSKADVGFLFVSNYCF